MNKNVYRITYDIAKNIQTIAQHCLKGNANFYSNVIFGFFLIVSVKNFTSRQTSRRSSMTGLCTSKITLLKTIFNFSIEI